MTDNHQGADQAKEQNAPTSPICPVVPSSAPPTLDEKWLANFYKECGREVTLAYTTLNQMKNWAMIIAASAISGVAFSSGSARYPTPIMFAGSVIVYTFVLRFFVRAILCYINLVRWNVLQSACIELKLMPRTGNASKTVGQLEEKLRSNLQHFYFDWLSPISRKDQLFQNLKLGFYLLIALSLFFVIWGGLVLWDSYLVRGLATFAFIDTVLEINDYGKSKFFDNITASEKRKTQGKVYEIFPVPASRGGFMVGWIINIVVSLTVATWPSVKDALLRLCH